MSAASETAAGMRKEGSATPLNPMRPNWARITKVVRETTDTFTLTAKLDDPESMRPFKPGQFSMLYRFATGELPISISGDPRQHGELVFTIRSVGKATHSLVTSPPGSVIGIRGPFGNGWPMERLHGKDVVIVAGGIGLAPLRPVIYSILAHRREYGRLVLLYGARTPRDQLYRKELTKWGAAQNVHVLPTVDYGGTNWRGYVGVVTSLFLYVRLWPFNTVALICGPEVMMRPVVVELEQRGIQQENLYLSMERNMKCAVGSCGHCQFGPFFVCKDGPVFPYRQVRFWIDKYEI